MDNIVLKVNGKALPKEVSKFKWKKADISGKSAGRTRDLLMHKDRRGKKRTSSSLHGLWGSVLQFRYSVKWNVYWMSSS